LTPGGYPRSVRPREDGGDASPTAFRALRPRPVPRPPRHRGVVRAAGGRAL